MAKHGRYRRIRTPGTFGKFTVECIDFVQMIGLWRETMPAQAHWQQAHFGIMEPANATIEKRWTAYHKIKNHPTWPSDWKTLAMLKRMRAAAATGNPEAIAKWMNVLFHPGEAGILYWIERRKRWIDNCNIYKETTVTAFDKESTFEELQATDELDFKEKTL